MRHRVYGKHLGRDKNQRTALFKGLIRSLILQEAITTTDTRAKAIKGLVDRLIVKSKENTNKSKEIISKTFAQKEVAKKLIDEIAPRYKNRTSGFTTIARMGTRLGDGAMMVKMSLIEEESRVLPAGRQGKSQESSGEDKKVVKKENKKKTIKKEEKV